jgi:hypothetical protein
MYLTLKDLVNIDSPRGFMHNAEDYCFNILTLILRTRIKEVKPLSMDFAPYKLYLINIVFN